MKALVYRLVYPLAQTYWFVRRPNVQGAGVILQKDNAILMVRHTYGHRDLWGLPGGRSKRGEPGEATARRELAEELGVTPLLQYLGEVNVTEDWQKVTSYCYKATSGDEPFTVDRAEIAETKWWPVDKRPENVYPTTAEALRLFESS